MTPLSAWVATDPQAGTRLEEKPMKGPGPMEAFDRLRADRAPPDRAPEIVGPGVHAVFVRDGDRLPGLAVPETGPLYIGQSDRVERRDHLTMDNSGYSTPRRRLGALLREPLRLTALPRAPGALKLSVTNYRFSDGGERRLGEWMSLNLEYAALAVAAPKGLEAELIRRYEPPLCLRGWPNPQARAIERLRYRCREEAARAP